MWSGLLTFTAFVVWGITGIYAIFLPAPGEWKPPEVSSRREFSFAAPGNLDDKELAKRVFGAAELKMAGGHYNVHRDDDQNLAFNVFTSNGPRNVTYFEDKKRVLVEFRDGGLGGFVSSMHTAHSRRGCTASTTSSRRGHSCSCRCRGCICGSRRAQECLGRKFLSA